MGEKTRIEWADHTFNPWIGCQKVGAGCDHCYAESWAKRSGLVRWGPAAERRLTSPANWRQPLKWNRAAEAAGRPASVFCASLADVFDTAAPDGARERLWQLIQDTPFLFWLLLTKRVGNVRRMLPGLWGNGWHNVGLMITVVDQAEADRDLPKLAEIPARLHGLSMEPLLGPVDLGKVRAIHRWKPGWVITGGESGPGARPMHPDWERDIRDWCLDSAVPYFKKQWGDWLPGEPEQAPYWRFQDGSRVDRHHLPSDLSDDPPGWDSGLSYVAQGAGQAIFRRVGKKAAGRLLDGRAWDEIPEVIHDA